MIKKTGDFPITLIGASQIGKEVNVELRESKQVTGIKDTKY